MPAESSAGLERLQQQNNRESADSRALFSEHRQRIMALVRETQVPSQENLMVLGAGNGNDLDLPALCREFRGVQLVDIDAEAIQRAAASLNGPEKGNLELFGGVDFLNPAVTAALPGEREIVVSTCVLSQLIHSHSEQNSLEKIVEVRHQHLSTMVDLLKSGGRGILVSDMVSSDTCPELKKKPPFVRTLMDRLIEEHNFFTGLNPHAILQVLYMNRRFAGLLSDIRFVGPWLWQLSPERTYLVYAITFRKKQA